MKNFLGLCVLFLFHTFVSLQCVHSNSKELQHYIENVLAKEDRSILKQSEKRSTEQTNPSNGMSLLEFPFLVAEQPLKVIGMPARSEHKFPVFLDIPFQIMDLPYQLVHGMRKISANIKFESVAYHQASIDQIQQVRPALFLCQGQVDENINPTPSLWVKRGLSDEYLRPISFSVGKLFIKFSIPDDISFEDKFLGTGVVIAENVLLTNRHVLDGYEWMFEDQENGEIFVEFTQERCQQYPEKRFTIHGALWRHDAYDAIALSIDPENPYGHTVPNPVAISNLQNNELSQGQFCSVIGFPAGYLQGQLEERSVFGEYALPKKRVQPGKIKALSEQNKKSLYKKLRYLKTDLNPDQYPVLIHDCSTLPGNSGSGIFSLGNGRLVGLHFAGERLKENYAIPMRELLKDNRFKQLVSR